MEKTLLEVIVCSLDDAIAAERGGATRLEVISHYELGGLTPPFDLVREIVETVSVPARVMLRDEEAFTVSDSAGAEKKIERLCQVARSFRELSIDGFVLGFLKIDPRGITTIDHELVARVLASAPYANATFHRAFEDLADPLAAISELKRHRRIDCILTSGGSEPWAEKLARFADWERAARPEIGMLVGGGTDAEVVRLFGASTPIRAFHAGRAVREGQRIDGAVEAGLVRELADLIDQNRER